MIGAGKLFDFRRQSLAFHLVQTSGKISRSRTLSLLRTVSSLWRVRWCSPSSMRWSLTWPSRGLKVSKQVARLGFQGFTDAHKGFQGHVPLGSFDLADVIPSDVSFFRELFLAVVRSTEKFMVISIAFGII
jgi:hypothetical protein